MKKVFLESGVPDPGPTGSVNSWPLGSEPLVLFIKDTKKFQKKKSDLPSTCQYFFVKCHKNLHVGSVSVIQVY